MYKRREGGKWGQVCRDASIFCFGFEVIFIFLNGTLCSFFVQDSDVEAVYETSCSVSPIGGSQVRFEFRFVSVYTSYFSCFVLYAMALLVLAKTET